MAVEVDAHARPVEAGRDLLDMGRLAGAVIARNHHATVIGKACEDRERRLTVEKIIRIKLRHIGIACRIGRHRHVGIDPEHFAHRNRRIRQIGYIPLNLVHHASRAAGSDRPRINTGKLPTGNFHPRACFSGEPDGMPLP